MLKGALLVQGPFPLVFLPYRASLVLSYDRGSYDSYLSIGYLHPYRLGGTKTRCIGEGSSRYKKNGQHILICSLGVNYRPGDRIGMLAEIGVFNNRYPIFTGRKISTRDFVLCTGITY